MAEHGAGGWRTQPKQNNQNTRRPVALIQTNAEVMQYSEGALLLLIFDRGLLKNRLNLFLVKCGSF